MAGGAADGGHALAGMKSEVAVDTGHAGLLVNVGAEVVLLDRIGSRRIVTVRLVWGPVLLFEVVIETAVIIAADPVAVMTTQALVVGRSGDEFMGDQFAVTVFEVAGGAAGPVPDLGVFISFIVDVAAEAASAEQVVGQLQGGGWRLDHRDFLEVCQVMVGPEMAADQIDRIAKGKMLGGGRTGRLLVAAAAFLLHIGGAGGVGDQAKVTSGGNPALVVAAMAGGAGKGGVTFVQAIDMAGPATGLGCGRDRRVGRGLWSWQFILVIGTAGQGKYK